jgi:mannose-6-phosphate isomerase-like protein (cupin superfamily)
MKFTVQEFLSKIPLPATEKWIEGVRDVVAFKKGNLSLVFFAPREKDYQTFHEEDEFYFIVRGKGDLIIDGERFICEVGDVFFVEKRLAHNFESFTSDFAVWAVFF